MYNFAALLMGAAIGSVTSLWFRQKFADTIEMAKKQGTMFLTLFSMLGILAKADGAVTQAEEAVVDDYMKNGLGLDRDNRQLAHAIFRGAKNSNVPFEKHAQKFYSALEEIKQEELLGVIELLLRVASAGGKYSAKKDKMILSAVRIFRIDNDMYEEMKTLHFPNFIDTKKHYAVLKCEPTDSIAKIKARYRRLAADYHPDKIQSKELPDDFMKFANKKFQEIQAAYQTIRKERGF
jgi:DnaJ like chaperone protein